MRELIKIMRGTRMHSRKGIDLVGHQWVNL